MSGDSWATRLAAELGIEEYELWRRLREEAGLSVRELAARVGVSHNAVHLWEVGHNQPSPTAYARLLEALAGNRSKERA